MKPEYVDHGVIKMAGEAVQAERDQSHADRALEDLAKADAELAHVIDRLAARLRPVTAVTDSADDPRPETSDPSARSLLVRSIRDAAARTQRMTRTVLEMTEGLDV